MILHFFFRIRAYESGDIEKGTLFEVPITVVQPIELNPQSNWKLDFETRVYKPNTITRHFVLVPNNATWAGMLHGIIKLPSLDNILLCIFYSA